MSKAKILGKLNPKQYSEMLNHLIRKKIKKPEVEQTEIFNRFNIANPRQDLSIGGRIGFDNGGKTGVSKKTALKDKKVKKFVELVEKGNSTTDAKKKVIKLFGLTRKKGTGTPPWMTEGKNILVDKGVLEEKERGSIKIIGQTEDFSKDKNIKLMGKKETVEPGIKKATYKNLTTGETFIKYKPLLRSNTVTVSGAGFDTLEQAQQTVKDYNKANPKKTAVTLKLEENLRTLFNNKRLAPLLESGVPDKKYLKVVQDILDLNVSQAEDKLKQLGEAVRPNSNFNIPGVDKINEKKAKNISNFYKSKSVSKKVVDQAIGESVGEKSLKNLRADVQRQFPFKGGVKTFETDEVKAKMGSFRLGSKPYSIFGQVIDGRLNQGDKMRYDSLLSRLEEDLQKALKGELIRDGKKITPAQAVAKYNAAAMEAEKKFNAYKTRGFKSVRIPKISLKSPDKTILNKAAYEKYKPYFDDNYSKLGYSFEIPKDLKPIPEIAKLLKDKNSPEYKSMIKNIKEIGKKFIKNINEYDEKDLLKIFNNPKFQQFKRFIPRLVSNEDFSERRYASANNIMSDATFVDPVEREENFILRNPITTTAGTTALGTAAAATTPKGRSVLKKIGRGAKAVGRGTLKLLGPLAVPLEAGFVLGDLKSGSTVPEALADVVMAGGIFRERDKRKFIEDKYGTETLNRYVAAKTPGITDVMDMPTALPALSQELQAIDAEADAYLQTLRNQRAQEFERKSNLPRPEINPFQAAGGGIAKLAGDRSGAMLESMNPDKDGLQGLMKRGMKI